MLALPSRGQKRVEERNGETTGGEGGRKEVSKIRFRKVRMIYHETTKGGMDKMNLHTAEVHRKEPQHGITAAITKNREKEVKKERDRDKENSMREAGTQA